MQDMFVSRQTVSGEDGVEHTFAYYVVVGEMEVGGRFSCESYGAKVVEEGGDEAVVPNITVSIPRIDALMELLAEQTVAPAGLRDVVDDWL